MTLLKKIFNNYEKITYDRLEHICDNVHASVYPKVRLADVFSITNSGISSPEFSFALKSHFDFIIYNNITHLPLFAVEFDGKYHRTKIQKDRDNIKDKLALKFNLPLLRINSRYLEVKYRNLDLLSWCVEIWFLADAFYSAQENGSVSYDEPFDPTSIYSIAENDNKFPFFLSLDIRKKLNRLFEQKEIKSPHINVWIGTDINDNYYGISWLFVNDELGLMTTSGMKAQNFPIAQSEFLEEIMIFELNNKLIRYIEGKTNGVLYHEIDKNIKKFIDKYKLAYASLSS